MFRKQMPHSTGKSNCSLSRSRHNRLDVLVHVWTISHVDFYLNGQVLKNDKDGGHFHRRLLSPVFYSRTKPQLGFQLVCYPGGNVRAMANEGHFSFYLVLSSVPDYDTRPNYRFTFSIFDRQYNKVYARKGLVKAASTFTSLGWDRFISHETLQTNAEQLLPNNELIFLCQIEVLDESDQPVDNNNNSLFFSNNNITDSRSSPTEQIIRNQAHLLQSGLLTDVVLVTDRGQTEHPAHRALLATQSPVFGAMFKHRHTSESMTGRVVIEDIDGDVVAELLRFVYTGSVQHLPTMADRLLVAADKYEMDHLKQLCSQALASTLDPTNAVAVLALANLYSAHQLRSLALEYVTANIFAIQQHADSQTGLPYYKCRLLLYRILSLIILILILFITCFFDI